MLKAYISPLGIGFGHASRCVSLAKRLDKEGFRIFFSAYGDAIEYIQRTMPEADLIKGGEEIIWKQKPNGQPDIKKTLSSLSDFRKFIEHLRKEKENIEYISPDIVISDSRASTLMASQYLGVSSVVILNQPKLLLSPLFYKAIPINRNLGDISIAIKIFEKLVNSAITRFWGLAYASIIADFPPNDSISRFHTSDLPKPLNDRVVFSGPLIQPKCKQYEPENIILVMISGPKRERESLAESILDLAKNIPPDLEDYRFIISLGDPRKNGVLKLSGNVTVYSWLPDKWEYLSRAKVVVSRAGHTTISEALVCGKPLLLIPVPGQTEKIENAKSVQDMGLGILLEQSSIKTDFFKAIRSFHSKFLRKTTHFRKKYENWNFIDRAIGVIEGIIY